jgi:hypothetical protein
MAALKSGKYVQDLLQHVKQNAVPSMVAVLFENQMAMARGMRCVLKVPVALAGLPVVSQWASVCPSMKSVDDTARKCNEAAAHTGFAFYDGFDLYGTEQEARDTRFVEPPVTRPNPVFDANYTADAFEHREVYRANTIVSVAGTAPPTPGRSESKSPRGPGERKSGTKSAPPSPAPGTPRAPVQRVSPARAASTPPSGISGGGASLPSPPSLSP